jgi:hypothetical protein
MTEYYSQKLANPDNTNATLDYLPTVDRAYPFDTPEFAEYNGLLSQPEATHAQRQSTQSRPLGPQR